MLGFSDKAVLFLACPAGYQNGLTEADRALHKQRACARPLIWENSLQSRKELR